MSDLIQYSSYIIIILVFLLNYKIFVTPEALEKKHREILDEADVKLSNALATKASKEELNSIRLELGEIKGDVKDVQGELRTLNEWLRGHIK